MSVENRKQDKVSRIESENSLNLRHDAESLSDNSPPNDESENEPTRRFAAPAREQEQTTTLQNAPDTDPTETFFDRELDKETAELEIEVTDELKNAPDENALLPSRLRFALVCLLFVFAGVVITVNTYQLFLQTSDFPEWMAEWNGERFVIISVDANFGNDAQVSDEILSVNNQPLVERYKYDIIFGRLAPKEKYAVQLKRGEQIREIELVAKPLSVAAIIILYLLGVIAKAVFLLTGLFIFLLKPNDRLILLMAFSLSLLSISLDPTGRIAYAEVPLSLIVLWQIGIVIAQGYPPILLHFFLLFPKPLPLTRHFPQIIFLIYLPYLLYVLPCAVGWRLSYSGLAQFNVIVDSFWLTLDDYIASLYLLFDLLILTVNYRRADETDKRRFRIFFLSVAFAAVPVVIYELLLLPTELISGFSFFPSPAAQQLSTGSMIVFAPPIFAYAVVHHKVIPVSLVIRRGLQYLFAKNALRLMLVLPILGVIWNVAANPNRTLSEILLNNSLIFYFCVAFTAALVLLNRFGLHEWVDRRFFREQYNQDKILRDLTEAVIESDSLLKLSRLVSSRIQLALHPENVYLFFRDDAHQSDFSLGYTTSSAGENSTNLKLAADSPLLRFMQQERGAIEFPTRRTDDLPNREKRWLREIGANLLVPMHGTDGKLAGFFALAEKMSQIPYTNRDKELLETLANQIALVQENLSLKDHVRREQKIKTEVLARFDEGNINLLKECPRCGKCFDRTAEKCDREGARLTFTLPVERTIENRYRLEKLLGKGGMGAVYEATDTRINRTVAVKILSGAMFGNRTALRRFEREAQTAGRLQHPHIVTVFDYGGLTTEGAFLVMELVRGESLREILDREEKLKAETVIAWFGQVLDGVEAAHKSGIIHRDLKPDNILVTTGESGAARLCILDFGLARFNEHEFADSVTIPGTIMGTLGYMPPEQLRGELTDERSDLFATGVMIYEALHGKKPYAGKTYQEIMQSMSEEITFGKDAPLADFFKRGLSLKPETRFASANEMKGELANYENLTNIPNS